MAMAMVNGVRLFYEVNGTAEVPLVLVHGSWASHHTWDLIVPRLADSFQVVRHISYATHLDAYVDAIMAFISKHST